jgi:hypothetical protein
MTFRFYIDGQQVTEPLGWDDFKEEIIRDDQERVLRYNYPAQLTFFQDGYELIEAAYQDSFANTLELIVTEQRGNDIDIRIRGIIKLSNCTFDISGLERQSVTVEIDDTVYQAYIFANQDQPIGVGGTKSIDQSIITPITPVSLTCFTVGTGANDFPNRVAYDVKDCMDYVLRAISNSNVSFASTWYDNLPDDERFCIITGAALRDPSTNSAAPTVTLKRLFEELWRKYNLYLIVESPLQNPVIRLEQRSYLFGPNAGIAINDVAGLTRSLDFEQMYGRIVVGSDKFIQEFGNNFLLVYLPFLSFVREQYAINSPIATEKELNLVSQFVIDQNKIANALENNVDENDGDIFMIQYDRNTGIAAKGEYLPTVTPTNRFYNEQLLNSNVLPRFDLMGNVVLNSGLLDATFQASNANTFTNTAIAIVPNQNVSVIDVNAFPADDDSTPPNFDTGNNYDTTTYQFTAPVEGFYRFRSELFFQETGKSITGINYQLRVRNDFFKNGQPVFVDEVYVFNIVNGEPVFDIQTTQGSIGVLYNSSLGMLDKMQRAEFTIFMAVGDTISARVGIEALFGIATTGTASYAVNCIFSNPTTPVSGGTYVENDPNGVQIGIYKADNIPVSRDDFDQIYARPQDQLLIDTGQGDQRITYPKKLSRNVLTSETEIEVSFNRLQANI